VHFGCILPYSERPNRSIQQTFNRNSSVEFTAHAMLRNMQHAWSIIVIFSAMARMLPEPE
jgi:hypothetical protein